MFLKISHDMHFKVFDLSLFYKCWLVGWLFWTKRLLETVFQPLSSRFPRGWLGGAMVLGKLPVPGRPTLLMIVGQGPTALVVGAGGGCLDIFTLI